ncbi:hypothetical protein BJF95_08050 [Rhizobium oryziradicis]|uniref:Uncharacterized protein n=1 Tax=Rhizobium oryziradicis TaxID=1867956 RepID=A0A1Q8ZQY8_9HYPH|nr:hypothetical protein BJF95_08050 [Rhizobium oryziradicis]
MITPIAVIFIRPRVIFVHLLKNQRNMDRARFQSAVTLLCFKPVARTAGLMAKRGQSGLCIFGMQIASRLMSVITEWILNGVSPEPMDRALDIKAESGVLQKKIRGSSKSGHSVCNGKSR